MHICEDLSFSHVVMKLCPSLIAGRKRKRERERERETAATVHAYPFGNIKVHQQIDK